MTISLDSVVFSNDPIESQIAWDDRYLWQPVGQSVRYALAGNPVVIENSRAGRPITLVAEVPWCWLRAATVEALHALASTPNQTMTLTWNTETYSVRFRRDAGPFDFTPVDGRRLYYTGSLYLIEV